MWVCVALLQQRQDGEEIRYIMLRPCICSGRGERARALERARRARPHAARAQASEALQLAGRAC